MITLEAEVAGIAEELVRHGLSPRTRVHVSVEVIDDNAMPMAAMVQAGGAFDWLADEPDLYDESDVIDRHH